MNKDEIIKQLREMAKHPTVTLPRDYEILMTAADLLAQPKEPEQEPVACIRRNKHDEYRLDVTDNFKVTNLPVNVELLLYTTPPQRTWVGLTDDEIDQGLLRSDYAFKTAEAWRAGVVFAMTKLKEKNT